MYSALYHLIYIVCTVYANKCGPNYKFIVYLGLNVRALRCVIYIYTHKWDYYTGPKNDNEMSPVY